MRDDKRPRAAGAAGDERRTAGNRGNGKSGFIKLHCVLCGES